MTTKHRVTLEQWRILQAVVDHGGYAQAAEALHRSPSSLNHAVHKLQQQLGVSLVQVQGRRTRLTPAGEVMLRRSRQLTDEALQLETLAENLQMGWEPELSLAVESLFPRPCLFRALEAFYPDSRGTRVRIQETVLTGTSEAIVDGRVDLAICGTPPKGFLGEGLGSVRLLPVAHPEHPLNRPGERRPQELAAELQLVIRDSGRQPQEHQGWLKAEQRWTLDSFDAALELLQAGLGFCWLPAHLAQPALENGSLRTIPLNSGRERRVALHLVVPRPDRLGPCGRELLMQLRDLNLD
ncbi:LysR family transcriptional regulator [Motiliproteus sp. SC1-56]|uniref:LysR family transcriptional regulator n=1 Tax=Motiliproteus sp. SC1-56 TaxID=2799565 RepID=UPI001A8FACDB|nr:LysR family transcriptional regulator [Motiliproteus sp. SC1-56]